MMRILKGQISIEFMIIFSFILVVFLFLFALITQQRALTQNSQTFSQLQLVAQSLALQISRASQAGTGYSALIPITTNIGNIPYNLSVTKSGVVIVSTKVGTQQITTTAYSNVQSILSSSLFYGATNSIYVLPITNGSIYLQNSFGVICIDYQCPNKANQSSLISLSSQNVHSAYFDGSLAGTSVLTGSDANALQSNQGSGFSFSAWVYPTNISTSRGITQGDSYVLRIDSPGEGSKLSWFVYINSAIEPRLSSTAALKLNKWYHVVGTYNSSTGFMGLYINGVLNNSQTRAGSPSLGYCSCFNIGVGSSSDWYGNIANAQLYDVGLSANQVKALYSNGIAAAPINSTYLRGWWTLNGNANDYSGYGDNLASSGVIFPAVSELFAKVTNAAGKPLSSLLVGFTTTLGNFTNGFGGPGQAIANYTDSNGMVTTFLNQQGTNGQALVKAIAFNGNITSSHSLVAWYPNNQGQGSTSPDISGNRNSATLTGQAYWSNPSSFAQFTGPQVTQQLSSPFGIYPQTNYIEHSNPLGFMGTAAQPFTVSLWIHPNSTSGVILDELGQQGPGAGWHDSWLELVNSKLYMRVWSSGCYLLGNISTNAWTNIAMSYNGGVLTGYINSVPTNSVTYSRQVPGGTPTMYYPLGAPDTTNCGSGLSYSGGISNLQFYSNALTQSQLITEYQSGISGTPIQGPLAQLWLPLGGTANDYSGYSNNGVVFGPVSFNPLQSSLPIQQIANPNASRILSASFNGVSSHLLTTSNSILSSSSNKNFTLEAWINASTTQPSFPTIMSKRYNSASSGFLWALWSNGRQYMQINGTNYANATGASLEDNRWHFVAITRSGSSLQYYVDGVPSGNFISALAANNIQQLEIGQDKQAPATTPFNGLISNIQILNVTLSPQQIQQQYFFGLPGNPQSSKGLVAWYALQGSGTDFGPNGYDATPTNIVYKNTIGFVPSYLPSSNYSGINLNGQTSYLIGGTNNLPSGSSSRSVFAWVYLTSTPSNLDTIQAYGTAIATELSGIYIGRSNLNVYFAGFADDFQSSLAITLNSWHFVGYTYSNSPTPQVTIYVDGKSQKGNINQLNTVLGSSSIGFDLPENGGYFPGTISNVQIYNYNLSASQVQQLYHSSNYPTATTKLPLSWYP